MKATFRISDLKNGKLHGGMPIHLMDDNYRSIESFYPHLVTEKGWRSNKSLSIDIDFEYTTDEEFGIGEFSESKYFELKAQYGQNHKVFNNTDSSTIRNIALCNCMFDPYDRG